MIWREVLSLDTMATGGAPYRQKTGENKAMSLECGAHKKNNGQDSPSELGTIPKWANSLWERLHFCVHVGGSELDVIEFDSSVLDIYKVQYSLSKKQIGRTVALLENSEHKIKLGRRKNECAVDIVIENDNTNESVWTLVENAFKKVISRFESNRYGTHEPARLSLLRQFQDNVPTEIVEVMIYVCRKSNQLFVVGEKEKLIQFITKSLPDNNDMSPSDKTSAGTSRVNYFHKLELELEQSLLLHYLGFEMFIENKYDDISVYISLEPPQYEVISPNKYDDKKWGSEIQLFLSKMKRKEIIIAHPLMLQLLFHKKHFPNQQLYTYIKEILKEHDVSFVFVNKDSEGVWVHCWDDRSVNLVANLVKTHIRFMNDLFISDDDGWNALKNWQKTCKLVYGSCKPKGENVDICCTTDIKHLILPPNFQFPKGFLIGGMIADFLATFGQDIIASIEEKYNTCINVSSEETSVFMCGDTKIEDISRELNKIVVPLSQSIPTAISKEYLQDYQANIDSDIKSLGCCWKLQPLNGQQRILSQCTLLASWHDPHPEKNVFVVEENLWEVDVDLQIVFTTQNLYPIEDILPSKAGNSSFEKFVDFGKQFIEKNGRQKFGFTTDLLTDVKNVGFATNYIFGMVVYSNGYIGKSQKINKDNFRKALEAIFQKASRTKISSIGISSSFSANSVDLTLIQQFVEYFMVYNSNVGEVTNLVISTHTSHTHTDQVKKHVMDALKGSHGICGKECSGNEERPFKDSKHQLAITYGDFQEHKADVFVNTTNKQLNLDVGALSKSILSHAGPELQTQCKTDYPTGISYGEVAVTDSYKLGKCGFKKIYHIALNKYDSSVYKEDIEKCVKKCLSFAERARFSKISFPAFGVGRLGYPRREVAACMVDAVNDFCTHCINPSLKKIKIVVSGDEETRMAFTDEVWRHTKGFGKDTGKSKPIVTSDFRSLDHDLGHLCVKIVTKYDYGTPPSYTVNLLFKGDGVVMKRASSKDCPSWNDELHLGGVSSLQQLRARLENEEFKEKMKSERITMAAIYTDEQIGLTEGQQAQIIVEFFRTINVLTKLEEVHIVVSEEDIVNSAAKLLKLDMTLFKKKTKPNCRFDLIGKSKEALKHAEAYLVTLDKLYDHESASLPCSSMVTTHAGQVKTITSSVTDEKNNKEASHNELLLETTHEVTAQLNPGLVSLNKNSSQWKKWIGEMETKFHVEINERDIKSDRCYACGSLDDIIEFEKHLNSMLTDEVSHSKWVTSSSHSKWVTLV